jgi:integrase
VDGLRFHDLRHTFASRLAMAGKDLYLIQKLLGHREPRMVQRYAHHSVESLRNGIEILETLKREASERCRITILSQLGNLEESHENQA